MNRKKGLTHVDNPPQKVQVDNQSVLRSFPENTSVLRLRHFTKNNTKRGNGQAISIKSSGGHTGHNMLDVHHLIDVVI